MTTSNNANRTIPGPPGGGSWRFDETTWGWVPNDPAPADQPDAQPAAVEQSAAALPTSEE